MTKMKFMKSVAATALLAAVSFVPAIADGHGHAVADAVTSTERPEEDRVDDAKRKPLEVLTFAGIKPGMTVVDLNSAGGYYTEILSRIVGPEGKVYAHNGPVYWSFMKETEPKRYAENRLANVVQLHDGNEAPSVPDESLDAAITVLAFHDYYFTHQSRPGGGYEDVDAVLGKLHKSLKKAGFVLVVDHVAAAGTGPAEFDTQHRIDPAFVQQKFEKAGFKLAATSDVLANPADDHAKSPFDPSIRRMTDRFIFKFEK
jgi:predicted methyltransferase